VVAVPEPTLLSSRITPARSFYVKALSETEQLHLAEAMQVKGLDEEIAVLRLRLLQALEEHPKDLELMLKGAALLARMVSTKYGLSKNDTDELAAAIERAAETLKVMEQEVTDA
jgi:hypothetical protein